MFTSAARSVSAEAPSNAALSEGDVVVAATGAGVGTSLCGAGITAADAAFLMGDCCGSAAGGGDGGRGGGRGVQSRQLVEEYHYKNAEEKRGNDAEIGREARHIHTLPLLRSAAKRSYEMRGKNGILAM